MLASPRSGSNFLQGTMSDASNLFMGNEFFTGGSNCNTYSLFHLKYINWYYLKSYKKDYSLKIYRKMFQVMASEEKEVKDRCAIGPEHLSLLIGFLKSHPTAEWSTLLKRKILKDEIIVKVFYNHYNYENHFDICEVIEMMENLILLYRENVLNQFISWCIATKTNSWFASKAQDIKNTKISWNLKRFLSFYEDQIKWMQEYKKHISSFSHKKTAIIKYEDINKKNYQQEIDKILQSNGIHCKLGKPHAIKQSKSMNVADNFVNKEEFLDQYSQIKDKILLKIEDI